MTDSNFIYDRFYGVFKARDGGEHAVGSDTYASASQLALFGLCRNMAQTTNDSLGISKSRDQKCA